VITHLRDGKVAEAWEIADLTAVTRHASKAQDSAR
jgi:hypothetical protein